MFIAKYDKWYGKLFICSLILITPLSGRKFIWTTFWLFLRLKIYIKIVRVLQLTFLLITAWKVQFGTKVNLIEQFVQELHQDIQKGEGTLWLMTNVNRHTERQKEIDNFNAGTDLKWLYSWIYDVGEGLALHAVFPYSSGRLSDIHSPFGIRPDVYGCKLDSGCSNTDVNLSFKIHLGVMYVRPYYMRNTSNLRSKVVCNMSKLRPVTDVH